MNSLKNEGTLREKFQRCRDVFDKVAAILQENYNVIASCNKDLSAYLVPIGTESEISYHSKPEFSFRVSDHWNWYSNLKKCSDEKYIQCESVDMPRAKPRKGYGMASQPVIGAQVCYFGKDGKYHCVYGEFYNRKKHCWSWMEKAPEEIAAIIVSQVA